MEKKIKILKKDILSNTEKALRYEWLENNGLGGYACSTSINCNIRKYHGLLNTPLDKGNRVFNLLNKIEPSIISKENTFNLSTNKYPDVYHPTGHKYAESFDCSFMPVIRYVIGDIVFEQSIMMPYLSKSILISYKLLSSEKDLVLQLNPLLSYRENHSLSSENFNIQVKTFFLKDHWKIEPYQGMPPLFFSFTGDGTYYPGPQWYNNFEYLKEKRRGYPYIEDLFSPGIFEFNIKEGDEIIFKASLEEEISTPLKDWEEELKRRKSEYNKNKRTLEKKYKIDNEEFQTLYNKSEQFLISYKREKKPSIKAGFPWFGEWGRDTMISLAGLTFYRDRIQEGYRILKYYASTEKNGLLPNQLSTNEQENSYNSIDSSLLFINAVLEYQKVTEDIQKVQKSFYKKIKNIINAFLDNQVENCRLNYDNGLLSCGNENTQLTWMDARVYGQAVTPRNGYPVEINALWYNALSYILELNKNKESKEKDLKEIKLLKKKIEENFLKMFLVENENYLADVVSNTGEQDTSLRPNQLFASALHFRLLKSKDIKNILEICQKHLLTKYGLRTLSPRSPKYIGIYKGNQEQRDAAYHQGTIWPWLIGIYTDSYLNVYGNNKTKVAQHMELLEEMVHELINVNGLTSISEIVQGNPPFKNNGCPQQAWSCAELIRSYIKTQELLLSSNKEEK